MDVNCGKCSHYKVTEANNSGTCKRYPPVVMMVPVPIDKDGKVVTSKLQLPVSQGMVMNSFFPTVGPQQTCGEYAPLRGAMS